MKNNWLLILLFSLAASSCNKYEEGPAFSLRTKKERLSNEWKVSHYSENGTDRLDWFNSKYQDYKMSISSTGGFLATYRDNGTVDVAEGGDWYFNEDKTEVQLFRTSPTSGIITWEIRKLKERDLRVIERDSTGLEKEIHFIPF